jgi:hypothetical protein
MTTVQPLRSAGETLPKPGDRPVWFGYYRLCKDAKCVQGTARGNARQRRRKVRTWKREGFSVEQQWYKVSTTGMGVHVIMGRYYKEL